MISAAESIIKNVVAIRDGKKKAAFLGFSFVSAQSQGFSNLLLRQSLAKAQKSSLRMATTFFQTL